MNQFKQWWGGLKSPERRWAVFIGGVVFLMLNYFFVWPHFGEFGRDAYRINRAQDTNDFYNAEVRHKDEYARKIKEFTTSGEDVLPEDQAIDFVRFVNNCAVTNNIVLTSQGNLVTHTNDYSLDQIMNVGAQSSETNLVNFLYYLGAGNSMIRVRAMSLRPDQSHMQLAANITLVASYQKKAPPARNATAAKTVAAPPPAAVPAPAVHPAKLVETNKLAPVPIKTSPTTNKLAGALARPAAPTNKPGSLNAKKP